MITTTSPPAHLLIYNNKHRHAATNNMALRNTHSFSTTTMTTTMATTQTTPLQMKRTPDKYPLVQTSAVVSSATSRPRPSRRFRLKSPSRIVSDPPTSNATTNPVGRLKDPRDSDDNTDKNRSNSNSNLNLPTTTSQKHKDDPFIDEQEVSSGQQTGDDIEMILSFRFERALKFVERILQVMDDVDAIYVQRCHYSFLRTYHPGWSNSAKVSAFSRDDMIAWANRLMETQDNFRTAGKPHHVDLAYHYTQEANMERIQADGLMTRNERTNHRIQVDEHGSAFGDGIYTANNPFCFRNYGKVGLLVARIQGTVRIQEFSGQPTMDGSFDTVVGNKLGRYVRLTCWDELTDNTQHDEVVLLTSKQCLPLFKYDRDLIPIDPTAKGWFVNPMEQFHTAMQSVVNEFFQMERDNSY